ncbi:DUF748 domain-containing protein [Mucilaginibacter terrenus]|uniref:DUF748 domain-containing protein n=1 Tax=Mucilaginibacter terrenus TaxID=2482727 RepID=A0A3E2NJM8_9SPHI|nr:DUF748 domain-containing protein [Mucilaginibacter terrenus]RFZ81214.1 DUF748 domain-containing protein [Mucilaginibacter terrenus]
MAGKLIRHKWQKVLLIVFTILLLLVFIPALLINHYWSPILSDKVKTAILEKTDSLYRVDYTNASLHVLKGEVIFYDITLTPDTAVYRRKVKQGFGPNNLYKLHVKRLVVSHIHPFTLYFKKKLDISRITLSAPELEVSYNPVRQRDTTTKDKRTLWQKISKSLKLIHVGDIYLNDVQFKYKDYSGSKLQVSQLKELNLKATDLLIDSATQTDRSRLLYCADIGAEVYNYTGKSADGLYTYHVKSAKLSTQTSALTLEDVNLKPVNSKMFFDDSQQDRFTLHFDTVQLKRFDFLTYHKFHTFNTANLILTKGSFSVYSNPNAAIKKTDRIVTFPQYGLKTIKAAVNIDTLRLRHIDVYYNEFGQQSKQRGYVAFNNTNGTITNITNNKDSLAKNHRAVALLNTNFMNQGKMRLKFAFNLTDPAYSYSYSGHLGAVSMPAVNPATMPLAMVKITSGQLNSLDFDINSTSKVSTGKVTLLYNNLKIKMLKADTIKTYKNKTLASLFVNSLIIKHDNPDDGEAVPRSANVRFVRPPTFPFFKTVWQTLFSGIKPNAGVGRAKEEQALKEMDKHDKKVKERALKKAEKAKKKAEEEAKKAREELEKKRKEAAKKHQKN